MRDLEQLRKSSQEKVDSYFSNIKILEYINSCKAKLFCSDCNYEWYGNLHNVIYNHHGCPVCSNQKVVTGINSLWDTHPHIAKHLKNPEDGYAVSIGSGKKVVWVCPSCGFETKPLQVCQITKHGLSCHKCSDKMSLPNKYMFNLLTMLVGEKFEYEVVFDWCRFQIQDRECTGRYDFVFAIGDNKYIVEMDGGIGHGNDFVYDSIKNSKHYRTKDECAVIDDCKDLLAKNNGYHMIRVDCSNSTFESITKNVKSSELSTIFDLESIDYTYLFEKCMTSRIFEAIDLWENGIKNTREIARIMRTSLQTVLTYLKQGVAIGKCSYTVEESIRVAKEKHSDICREKLGTKVVCLTTGEVFNSYAKAKEVYNIKTLQFRKNQTLVTFGKHPDTQEDLVWQKYEDYIKTA